MNTGDELLGELNALVTRKPQRFFDDSAGVPSSLSLVERVGMCLGDKRVKAVVYVPWTEEDLETVKKAYPQATEITY